MININFSVCLKDKLNSLLKITQNILRGYISNRDKSKFLIIKYLSLVPTREELLPSFSYGTASFNPIALSARGLGIRAVTLREWIT